MTGRIRTASRLALLCAVVAGSPLAAQPTSITPTSPFRPGYEPVQMQRGADPASPSTQIHVAVVGAVRNPAVYRTKRPLTFVELIDAAGGPDADASSSVQIVRQGRIDRLIYDPRTPVAQNYGPLLDGDVVILRPQPGVRNAMYQTTTAGDDAGRRAAGVQHAMRPRLSYVACLGLLDRPVVLPLNPDEATLPILLSQMLRLSGPAAAGVRVVANAAQLPVDGVLANGTVIEFDRRVIGPRDLQPIQEYPAAREVEAATPTAPPSEQKPPLDTPPSVPKTSRSSGSPGEMSSTPPMAQPGGQPRQDALQVPGLPFVVRDTSPSGSSIWLNDAAANVTPPAPGLDGHYESSPLPGRTSPPIDVTEHAVNPHPERANSLHRPIATAHIPAGGIPADSATTGGVRLADVAPQAGPAAIPEDSEIHDAAPDAGLSAGQWVTAICGSLLAAILGGLAAWLWWLEIQQSRTMAALAATVATTEPAVADRPLATVESNRHKPLAIERTVPAAASLTAPKSTTLPPAATSSVQELIERQLPIREETALSPAELRLYGRTIGARQLRWDPPQTVVAAPHFVTRAQAATGPNATKLEQRLDRVVQAVRTLEKAAARTPPRRTASEVSAPVSSTAPSQPFAYDIVQPVIDAAAGPRRSTGPSRATHEVRPASSGEGYR